MLGKGATGGAPMTSPRPMANPGMTAPQAQPAPGGGGMFPGLTPQKRYDMAMELLQQGMASATGSGNPLLSFLSPFAGAVIGGNLQGKADAAEAASLGGMNETLLGTMGSDPRAQGLVDILNNPDAPDYARSMAKDQLTKLMAPPKASGGKTGSAYPGKAPSNSDALLTQLMYRAMDPGGDGGEAVTAAEQARMDSFANLRSRKSSASVTYGRDEATSSGGAVTKIGDYTIQEIE